MKRYYIVLTPFFPSEQNFVGSYIYDQVKAIQKLSNLEVVVITSSSKDKTKAYTYEGILVYPIKLADLPSFVLPGLFNAINYKKIINQLIAITGNKLDHIQVIHGHVTYPFGVLASKIAKQVGATSVVQHHGFDVMGYTNGRLFGPGLRELNKKWINKFHVPLLNGADWNVGVSQRTLDELHQIKGYQPTKEYVLYNGVDKEKFYPIIGLKEKNQFKIGCVGNFWPLKDQITLIKAAQLLVEDGVTDFKVVFIGSGATLSSCKAYVQAHQLSAFFEFKNEVKHTELVHFFNSLNLFVMPSYWEAFGCVYLEAHACGVPFIGVKDQGIAELVKITFQTKQLINKEAVTELYELLKFYKANPDFRAPLNVDYDINDLVKNFLDKIQVGINSEYVNS